MLCERIWELTTNIIMNLEDYALQLQWCDGKWESWEELQSSSELEGLRKSAQEKLDRAKTGGVGGGKGKGKADSQ